MPFVALIEHGVHLYESHNTHNALEEVTEKLIGIGQQVQRIADSVDDVFREELSLHDLKNQIRQIDNVNRAYNRYLDNPTNVTKAELLRECDRQPIIHFFNYLDSELIDVDYQGFLMNAMTRDFEWNKTKNWNIRLMTSASQALILTPVCLGLRYNQELPRNSLYILHISHIEV